MRAKAQHKLVISVHLDEDEAKWLLAVMQNPLGDTHPDDESEMDREMRKELFNTLLGQLEK